MQFNSTPFLFLFLPVFLAIYYLLPARWRSPLLILGSFVFYAFSCSGQDICCSSSFWRSCSWVSF